MSEAGGSTAGGPPDETSATGRPALDVRPLAAWWLIFAGIVTALLFILTDHVLRATLCFGGSLLLAAVLRVTLPGSKAGGIAVRGPLVDLVILIGLGVAVLVAGFTLDLTAPFALPGRGR